jgi:hypothetical protein
MGLWASEFERFLDSRRWLTLDLLIPLSHPSELVTHPALVRIFRSNKIHVLAEQALASIRAEHEHMTRLSRLLSVLLGDESIVDEPEPPPQSTQPLDDTESDKDVDIMDLDEPIKETEQANGEPNGHAEIIQEPNGIETNGESEQIDQSTADAQRSESMDTDAPQPNASTTEENPQNGTAESPPSSPSRTPTPQTRPTTRLQTAATRPPSSDSGFQWPASFLSHIPVTTAADLGLSSNEAAEVRRMVQATLERSQEFLRCLYKVRAALVRADKQRKQVWSWCKDSAKLVAEQEKEDQ